MGLVGKMIYSTISSKSKVEKYQQIIRDEEWKELENEIAIGCTFLDVGCGAGYAMFRASKDKICQVFGVDPEPGAHGVGRFINEKVEQQVTIIKGSAESLPFEDNTFDVVFSSHVLEHVTNENNALKEMSRVLKPTGKLIIGMPTASMATINYVSSLMFTTHIKIYEFFRFFFTKNIGRNLVNIFRIRSHSYPRNSSIFYDLIHYRVKNWEKIVSKEFNIIKTLQPFLYPYPDYPQFFKIHKSHIGSSSVFFICTKK